MAARRQSVVHSRCVTVREHLSRNKRTLSSSCIDALDHFDVATMPHCIATLHARMRRGPRRKVTENGRAIQRCERDLDRGLRRGAQYALTRDSCEVLWGGDLYRRLEEGRIRYTSKPYSNSSCSYRFGNELSTLRSVSGRNADTFMWNSALLIVQLGKEGCHCIKKKQVKRIIKISLASEELFQKIYSEYRKTDNIFCHF